MSRSGKRLRNNRPKGEKEKPFFSGKTADNGTFFQTKPVRIGQPGDKYEKEADAVASRVTESASGGPVVQEKEISQVRRESLATPLEDERLGTAEQRMEEDKLIQEQAEDTEKEEEPEVQMQAAPEDKEELISRQATEEEDMVNRQAIEEDEEMVNRQTEEEDEQVIHRKEDLQPVKEEEKAVQAKSISTPCAPQPVAQSIRQATGKGKPLSGNVKKEMEKSLNADLSTVRIHTYEEAALLCRKLKAHAFTFGKDVFFNTGKYQPEQAAGRKLLAHELTHVLQQNQSKKKKN